MNDHVTRALDIAREHRETERFYMTCANALRAVTLLSYAPPVGTRVRVRVGKWNGGGTEWREAVVEAHYVAAPGPYSRYWIAVRGFAKKSGEPLMHAWRIETLRDIELIEDTP